MSDHIRRSARIADASYRPRTSRYDFPEIMSGVAPSGFGNRERRDEGDMDVDSELLARRASLTRPEA